MAKKSVLEKDIREIVNLTNCDTSKPHKPLKQSAFMENTVTPANKRNE